MARERIVIERHPLPAKGVVTPRTAEAIRCYRRLMRGSVPAGQRLDYLLKVLTPRELAAYYKAIHAR